MLTKSLARPDAVADASRTERSIPQQSASRIWLAGNNVVYDWTHIRRLVQPIHWENL